MRGCVRGRRAENDALEEWHEREGNSACRRHRRNAIVRQQLAGDAGGGRWWVGQGERERPLAAVWLRCGCAEGVWPQGRAGESGRRIAGRRGKSRSTYTAVLDSAPRNWVRRPKCVGGGRSGGVCDTVGTT